MSEENLPKLHERYLLVKEAEDRMTSAIFTIGRELKLTHTELQYVLMHTCSREILFSLKFDIRKERHDDTDTPGDVG